MYDATPCATLSLHFLLVMRLQPFLTLLGKLAADEDTAVLCGLPSMPECVLGPKPCNEVGLRLLWWPSTVAFMWTAQARKVPVGLISCFLLALPISADVCGDLEGALAV